MLLRTIGKRVSDLMERAARVCDHHLLGPDSTRSVAEADGLSENNLLLCSVLVCLNTSSE